MAIRTPWADLIEPRMRELGLDRQAVGFRLGYQNPLKAAGRVSALCEGHITSAKSPAALNRLPQALEVPVEVIEQAVAATEELFAEMNRWSFGSVPSLYRPRRWLGFLEWIRRSASVRRKKENSGCPIIHSAS